MIEMNVEGDNYRTVWFEGGVVKLINQPLLPHSFEVFECKGFKETADAISSMVVRGAPAIGASACFGMAQGALEDSLDEAEKLLGTTRPTAYDLFHAINYFKEKHERGNEVEIAQAYADQSAARCKKIGVHGAQLIKDGMNILTHCNAGALGCVDWGTATAPMRIAKEKGVDFHVWVDETRPRCQGSRLTAWELGQEEIPHTVIADNTAGSLMRQGEIDLVVVGADRIAGNGDVANKVGTYTKAVLAAENNIPFYVAAPTSTFHNDLPCGADIPIEKRDESEVSGMWGFTEEGNMARIQIAPRNSRCLNQAFDLTPKKYVIGYITENGVEKL